MRTRPWRRKKAPTWARRCAGLTGSTNTGGGALVLRRLAFSVPFSVSVVRPLFRAPLPEVAPMLGALRLETRALVERFGEMVG